MVEKKIQGRSLFDTYTLRDDLNKIVKSGETDIPLTSGHLKRTDPFSSSGKDTHVG
jgi:hypothetical protein